MRKFKRTNAEGQTRAKRSRKCIFKLKENWTICRKSRFVLPNFEEMHAFDRRREIVDRVRRTEPINRFFFSKTFSSMCAVAQRFNESKMEMAALIFDTVPLCRCSDARANNCKRKKKKCPRKASADPSPRVRWNGVRRQRQKNIRSYVACASSDVAWK